MCAFNLTRPDADPPDSHVLLPALLVQWLCCCKAAYLDMLEGAASIFEGIDGAPLRSIPPQRASGASGPKSASEIACCGSRQVLLSFERQPARLLSLSADPTQTGQPAAEQHGTAAGRGCDSSEPPIQLHATYAQLQQPDSDMHDAQLLHCCWQPSTVAEHIQHSNRSGIAGLPLAGCSTPCWLTLYKAGSALRLYVIPEEQQQDQHDQQHQPMQLLAELQHEEFTTLQPQQCWLTTSAAVLLQLHPEQLILLAPSPAVQCAAGLLTAVAGTADSTLNSLSHQCWQMDLPAWDILQCLDQTTVLHLLQSKHAAAGVAVPVLSDNSNHCSSSLVTAAQPWRLLHCQPVACGMQLLLSLEVAAAGDSHMHSTADRQQKQQLGLLVWLDIELNAASAGAAANEASCSMQVSCCWATGWEEPPNCVSVLLEKQREGSVAIGSNAGALQLLKCRQQQAMTSDINHQWGQVQTSRCSAINKSVELQSSGSVSGPVHSIELLPQVVAAGAVHCNVLAVLHHIKINSSTAVAAVTAVTLMVQWGDQLQAIAEIQGAAALIAPCTCAPLGLMCPWRQQRQQPGNDLQAASDSSSLQLAALVMLDQHAGLGDGGTFDGLQCYAELTDHAGKHSHGPMVGLLQQIPPSLQQRWQQHEAAAADQQQKVGGDVDVAAANINELRGLQTMLAALEMHWQQESLDIAALQHKLKQGQTIAASAHRKLCQLAGDTIQTSIARQHSLPFTQLDSSRALAAYHLGRQSQQEQQQKGGHLSGAWQLQLTLELVSCSNQLRATQLQLEVHLRPILRLQQQQQQLRLAAASVSCDQDQCYSWRGPLLQPCHAELLLWHDDLSPVTSQCSWDWDAVAGTLAVRATLAQDALLQVAYAQPVSAADVVDASGAQEQLEGDSKDAAGDVDQYICVARHIAATVSAGLDPAAATKACDGSSHSAARPSVTQAGCYREVCLSAAVVVAACCSKQAVAQAESGQLPRSNEAPPPAAGMSSAEQAVLLRSHLLKSTTALLHLPPVRMSLQQLLLQQLLLQQLTGSLPADAKQPQSDTQPPASNTAPASHLHTPTRDKGTQAHSRQVMPASAAVQGSELQGVPTGFANTDVIPPTPCDEVAPDDFQHEMVVADSQPEDDDAVHQVTQLLTIPPAAAAAAAAVPQQQAGCDAAAGAQEQQAQQRDKQLHTGHQRLLLLQGPAAVLQHFPLVLIQQLGWIMSKGTATAGLQVQQPQTAAAMLSARRQHMELQRLQLQPPGGTTGVGSNNAGEYMELAWCSKELIHVEVSASSDHRLDTLQRLLLLAAQGMPGGRAVTVQLSPLSSGRLARYLSATDALTQAVQLQCKVIEETLQQLHHKQRQQQPPHDDAAAAPVDGQGLLAARGSVAGVKRTAPDAISASVDNWAVVPNGSADPCLLSVDGVPMSGSLSDCWVSLYNSQADVDLAVSQLDSAMAADSVKSS